MADFMKRCANPAFQMADLRERMNQESSAHRMLCDYARKAIETRGEDARAEFNHTLTLAHSAKTRALILEMTIVLLEEMHDMRKC